MLKFKFYAGYSFCVILPKFQGFEFDNFDFGSVVPTHHPIT